MALLSDEIFREFPVQNDLSREEIAPHECDECYKIRDDFFGRAWDKMDSITLEYHHDSLPLLSPKAFQYYLPAYLLSKLKDTSSIAADMLEYSLCPYDDKSEKFIFERKKVFTSKQKQVIVQFLEYFKAIEEYDPKEYERGIEFWKK